MLRVLLLVSLLAPLGAVAQTTEQVPRPEVKVGDNWTYRITGGSIKGSIEIQIRVTLVDEKSIVGFAVRKRDGKEIDAIWTPEWNGVSAIDGTVYRPNGSMFRFPLAAGNRHQASYEIDRPSDRKGAAQVAISVHVVGWETVEVPAGSFRALRLEATFNNRSDAKVTVWYSPEVKRWVRYLAQGVRANRDEVLLSYKLN